MRDFEEDCRRTRRNSLGPSKQQPRVGVELLHQFEEHNEVGDETLKTGTFPGLFRPTPDSGPALLEYISGCCGGCRADEVVSERAGELLPRRVTEHSCERV